MTWFFVGSLLWNFKLYGFQKCSLIQGKFYSGNTGACVLLQIGWRSIEIQCYRPKLHNESK